MRVQDFIVKETRTSAFLLVRAVKHVPEDKRDWKPLDNGRSVMDQFQECAYVPLWLIQVLETRGEFQFKPEMIEEAKRVRQSWTTFEECQHHLRQNTDKLLQIIADFPDDELESEFETVASPKGKMTMAEAMMVHMRNLMHHVGQINYIQTLYGDFDFHMN